MNEQPDELRRLWLGSAEEENIQLIMAQTLQEAKKWNNNVLRLDGVVMILTVIGIVMLIGFYSGERLALVARLILAGLLGLNLAAYWRFYRAFRNWPAPDTPSRAYLEHCIRYQDRRGRFIQVTLWFATLLPVSGTLYIVTGIQEDESSYIGFGALLWLALALGWVGARFERRRLEERSARLRHVLEDNRSAE